MGKTNELSMLVHELRKCGEVLMGISEELTAMFSCTDEEIEPEKKKNPANESKEEKSLTLEDVRAVCSDKSRQGFTSDVKAILAKHGVDKLSEVDPAEYKALLAEVEVLGNAK